MEEEYEELVDIDESEIVVPVEDEEKKVNFFDLFNDISNNGTYLDTYFEANGKLPKEYSSFMMNKAFANFRDTIYIANEMNKNYFLPDEMQWRFLKNTVNKRKRFSKWFKSISDDEPIELLAKYFNCSVKEMQKNIHVIPKDKINELLKELNPDKYKK